MARGPQSTRAMLRSQAKRDALLKFAPQRAGLQEALQNARETYGSTVQAGRSSAALTKQATEQAKPEIQQIYQKADAGQQAGATLVSKALAGLTGPAADTYKAAQAGEVQQQLANLLGARARNEATLHQRGVAAQAGAQFNQTQARQALQKTVAQLISKRGGLSAEEGEFTASEADKLAKEAEDAERSERQSERTAQTSREGSEESAKTSREGTAATTKTSRENAREAARTSRENAREGGGGAGGFTAPGVKRLTADQHNTARDTIETIRHEAYEQRTAKPHQLNFAHAKIYLETPVKGVHPAYANNARLKAGLELAYFGGISDGTIKQLHGEGLSVKQLGYPRYRKVNGTPRLEKV